MFLGYDVHCKGYRCYDKSTGKIYISRHVLFNELSFPFANDRIAHIHGQSITGLCAPYLLPSGPNHGLRTAPANQTVHGLAPSPTGHLNSTPPIFCPYDQATPSMCSPSGPNGQSPTTPINHTDHSHSSAPSLNRPDQPTHSPVTPVPLSMSPKFSSLSPHLP